MENYEEATIYYGANSSEFIIGEHEHCNSSYVQAIQLE